jgi:repressor LexA
MTAAPLTEKQKDVLRYMARHISKLGFQPSMREIADHFGWRSAVSARNHLLAMEKKGVLVLGGEPRAVSFYWKRWAKRRSK